MPDAPHPSHDVFHDTLSTAKTATLCVLDFKTGGPLGTLVNIATDDDGLPLFLLSELARHTQCLNADPRASVLIAEPLPSTGDALVAFRATLTGTLKKVTEPQTSQARDRYLQHQPDAALYADFGDFSFWRLEPEHVFMVAGFGKISNCPASELF